MQVPQRPRIVSLSRLTVGQPASARAIARWNDDLAFLNSYAVQPVCSHILQLVSTTPHSYYVGYTKTPGTKALRVMVEPNQATAGTRPALSCLVTCSTGTIAYMDTGSALWADGSSPYISVTSETMRDYDTPSSPNTIDVSQLIDGTTYDLKFTITDRSGTGGISRGLYRIHVVEVPLATIDPIGDPANETGVNPAWLTNTDRNAIVDGTDTSLSYGMRRIGNQLAIARYQKRRQMQLIAPELTSLAWNVTGSAGGAGVATTAFPFGYSGAPVLRIRSPMTYSNTAANWLLRLRYQNSAGNKLKFRIAVTPVGGGATVNNDFTLANTASFAAATVTNLGASMTFTTPISGTSQECDLEFYADNDTAATTSQVSQIYIRSNEV